MRKVTRRETIAAAAVLGTIVTKASAVEKGSAAKIDRAPSSAFEADTLSVANASQDGFSMAFLDNNTMMSLIYDIPAGADAPQTPHGLDELYVVLKGRSKFMVKGKEYPVKSGTILFVKAGDEHYFKDVEEDLQVVIIFSKGDAKQPPYYERNK